MSRSGEAIPIKISCPSIEAVRHGSRLYNESQLAFINRVTRYFFVNNLEELQEKEREFVERTKEVLEGLRNIGPSSSEDQ